MCILIYCICHLIETHTHTHLIYRGGVCELHKVYKLGFPSTLLLIRGLLSLVPDFCLVTIPGSCERNIMHAPKRLEVILVNRGHCDLTVGFRRAPFKWSTMRCLFSVQPASRGPNTWTRFPFPSTTVFQDALLGLLQLSEGPWGRGEVCASLDLPRGPLSQGWDFRRGCAAELEIQEQVENKKGEGSPTRMPIAGARSHAAATRAHPPAASSGTESLGSSGCGRWSWGSPELGWGQFDGRSVSLAWTSLA